MNPYLLLGTGLAVVFLWLRSHTPTTLGGNAAGQQATTPGVDSASGGASGGDGAAGFTSPYAPVGTVSYGPPTQSAPDQTAYAPQASQPTPPEGSGTIVSGFDGSPQGSGHVTSGFGSGGRAPTGSGTIVSGFGK